MRHRHPERKVPGVAVLPQARPERPSRIWAEPDADLCGTRQGVAPPRVAAEDRSNGLRPRCSVSWRASAQTRLDPKASAGAVVRIVCPAPTLLTFRSAPAEPSDPQLPQ